MGFERNRQQNEINDNRTSQSGFWETKIYCYMLTRSTSKNESIQPI